MLYEIPHIRPSHRSHVKRWFTCQDMDLFVWFRNNIPVRFQLAYDKQQKEKAICWDTHRGFSHYLVDSGETSAASYKQTPILIGHCGQHDMPIIARAFLAASEEIDTGLCDFIYARLMEIPAIPAMHDVAHTGQTPL